MSENGFFPKLSAFVWPPIWVIPIVVMLADKNAFLKIREAIIQLQGLNCLIVPSALLIAGALYWYSVYNGVLNVVLFLLSVVFFATGIGAPISAAMWGWIALNLALSAVFGEINPMKLGIFSQTALQFGFLWAIGSLAFCVFGI